MKLYKYRPLDSIEFVLDILVNERLHCAHFEHLNDPLEGVFLWKTNIGAALGAAAINTVVLGGSGSSTTPKSVTEMPLFGSTRVCSLSATPDDVRLWSHYANGHTGIAIEIEIDDSSPKLHEVEYVETLKEFSFTVLTGPKSEDILRLKTSHWRYENEFRIIGDDEFYSIPGMVTGVLFGLRTPEILMHTILRTMPDEIPAFSTRIDEQSLKIVVDRSLRG